MLYFRPFYVESSRNPFPKLDYFIVVYGGAQGQSRVAFQPVLHRRSRTFSASLCRRQTNQGTTNPTGPGTTVNANIQSLIAQAGADYQQAQTDLKAGNFAAYGTDIQSLQSVLQQLQQASGLGSTAPTKTNSTTTTTTTVAPGVALGRPNTEATREAPTGDDHAGQLLIWAITPRGGAVW